MSASQGPYVQVAAMCQNLIEDKQGVLSLVRVVNQVVQTAIGREVPSEMPPVEMPLTLVISLCPGAAIGNGIVTIKIQTPDGVIQPNPLFTQRVDFHGQPDRLQNIVLGGGMKISTPGLYWFCIYYQDLGEPELLTKSPLRVVYSSSQVGGPLPGQGSS